MADLIEEDSSLISDHSFVILGQGSPPLEMNDEVQSTSSHQFSLQNGECSDNDAINGESEAIENFDTANTSPFAIQMKLDKLVKENLLLKETLNQSNLAMKNQFDTLALWHEEVVKTHESHKQKFQETQDQIFKLRNENMSLKKLIQQNLEKCNGNNSGLANLQLEGSSSEDMMTDVNSKEVNFHYIYIEELRLKNIELERKLLDATEEILNLQKKLEKALEEINDLKKEAESKTDKCTQCQGSKSLISDKILNEEIGKYNELGSLERQNSEMSVMDKLTKSVEAELILSSKENLAELRKQLAEQSKISEKTSEELEDIKVMYEEILKQNVELNGELQQSKMYVKELTDKTASLNEELKLKELEIENKALTFEKMKKDMQKLVLDCEEVAILRAQVELYENDFNEERRAREQAVGEKEKIAEQVRFLERALNELKKNDDKEENKTEAPTAPPLNEDEARSYICPRCMKRFLTLSQCESHVDSCLDLDMFP